MKRQPRLPRDRWPRLLDALRLACGLTVDEAEAVLLEQRDYVGRTPRRLLEHMERFGIRTPAGRLLEPAGEAEGDMVRRADVRGRPGRSFRLTAQQVAPPVLRPAGPCLCAPSRPQRRE
jgi:hypothetical protein